MNKYITKKNQIEAHQWFKNGDHPEDFPNGLNYIEGTNDLFEGKVVRRFRDPEISGRMACKKCGDIYHHHGWIETLKGGHTACPGDYIIKGVEGEFYPCKPDTFELTYDKVE
tara:strand:- start:233 stop:568 length:336 start_codon:yes stop_codon:yes gene_type:complete